MARPDNHALSGEHNKHMLLGFTFSTYRLWERQLWVLDTGCCRLFIKSLSFAMRITFSRLCWILCSGNFRFLQCFWWDEIKRFAVWGVPGLFPGKSIVDPPVWRTFGLYGWSTSRQVALRAAWRLVDRRKSQIVNPFSNGLMYLLGIFCNLKKQ